MKTKSILAALLLIVAGMQTTRAQKYDMKVWRNGTFTQYFVNDVDSVTFSKFDYEWVDLELPSGTLWATCNVGASKPEEYGDYFAWGETTTKSTFNWDTYFDTDDDGNTFKKYNTNGGLTELSPEDDAATVNWGSEWQTPSFDQIRELYNSSYTTSTWTTQNGVQGRKITSKSNGKSIFLPPAGLRNVTTPTDVGRYGYYWSRTLSPNRSSYARYLYFYSGEVNWGAHNRYHGRTVRPVRKQ